MTSEAVNILARNKAKLIRRLVEEQARRKLGRFEGQEWAEWLLKMFPSYLCDSAGEFTGFADFHAEFWEHIWKIEKGVRPEAFIAIWPRDTGKSTNAELACVALAARQARRYVFYVCGTQDQADDHVNNIGSMLEGSTVAEHYPLLGERQVTKFGQSRGWRINRLRTASGFVVDAIGLDKAVRGKRLEEMRPDFAIFDDIDDDKDTPYTVSKKEKRITRTIIPALSDDGGIAFVQNLIHANSIACHIVDGTADYLKRRYISGPYPAIHDLEYKHDPVRDLTVITGGTPSWSGLSMERCQAIVEDIGITSFLVEHQHNKHLAEGMFLGGIWNESVHVLNPTTLPKSWPVMRCFDWGSAHPYACIWLARSDGETPLVWGDRRVIYPKGSIHAIQEVYGDGGKPNKGTRESIEQIAERVKKAQRFSQALKKAKAGPADLPEAVNGKSIEDRFSDAGVKWEKAIKGPGSRITSADRVATMLKNAVIGEGQGLYVWKTCPNLIRTLPILPKDELKPDDVDTDAEDHAFDALKMGVVKMSRGARKVPVKGL